jgi:hypothetical protein
MKLTLPTVDLSGARSDLTDLGPRARSAIADLDLPRVDLGHVQVPDRDHLGRAVKERLSDAGQAMTGSLSDAGRAVGGPLSDTGHAVGDALSEAGHAVSRPLSDAGHAVGDALSDAGHTMSGPLSDAGHAMSGAFSDAGQLVAGALAAAGERWKEMRPRAEPRRRSIAPIAIGGVVVGAIAVAVGTVAAFLMDPIHGARRRAAVRHRVEAMGERMRELIGMTPPTKLLEAPKAPPGQVAIEVGPGETPDMAAARISTTDEAVPVTAASGTHRDNGSGRSSDSVIADAAGE